MKTVAEIALFSDDVDAATSFSAGLLGWRREAARARAFGRDG